MVNNRHIIFSNYINAYSIAKALKKIGFKDIFLNKDIKTSYFCNFSSVLPEKNDLLFFTTEYELINYLNKDYNLNFNISNHNIIDNKYEFAKFLRSINELPVPDFKEIDEVVKFPVLFKGKASIKNGIRVPRGFLINSKNEFKSLKLKVIDMGFEENDYFIQKYLINATKNISVVGYFNFENPSDNILLITEKVIMDNRPLEGSTGDVVVEINDPSSLIKRTNKIMDGLKYKGVFELEYIYDMDVKDFLVLELNPRFWMQHGIFERLDNILIKKYLEIPTLPVAKKNKKLAWVNGLVLFNNFFSTKNNLIIFILKNCRKYNYHFAPSLYLSLKYSIHNYLKYKPIFKIFLKQ